MKEIIIKKTVFEFNELSEKAKEKAIEDYKNDAMINKLNADYFLEDFKEELNRHNFTGDTSLKMQYDYSYTQGSGLNLYGTLGVTDIYKFAEKSKNFTDAELHRLKFYKEYLDGIKLSENVSYIYSLTSQDKGDFDVGMLIDNHYIIGENMDVDDALLNLMYKDKELIKNMYLNAFNYIDDWESELYDIGEKIFCADYTKADMAEVATCNDWYYYTDGSLATDIL